MDRIVGLFIGMSLLIGVAIIICFVWGKKIEKEQEELGKKVCNDGKDILEKIN